MTNFSFTPLHRRWVISTVIAIPYVCYLVYILSIDRGPIDYETFMSIGGRLLSGEPVYTTNSYYPMPFAMLFSLFASLPRPVSMAVWLLSPVVCAWLISGKNPLILLFAPLYGQFIGGQASIFGMWGLWGYRKYQNPEKALGGVYLALTLLKPQLGVVPLLYAAIEWVRWWIKNKRIPAQCLMCALSSTLLFLPGFLIDPDWVSKWLRTPRPLFARALSGFIPRTLILCSKAESAVYWIFLIVISLLLLVFLLYRYRGRLSLDSAVIWGFIASPLVHDYDLIQLVPMLDKPWMRKWALFLSIPGWLVILFAYSNDQAWYAFTLIAPGMLLARLLHPCPEENSGVNAESSAKQKLEKPEILSLFSDNVTITVQQKCHLDHR